MKTTDATNWDAQANFVFKGTVRKLKATTVPHLPATNSTVVVKVEQALRAPEMLEAYAGSEITVQLSEGERVRAGEQAVFYTRSLMVGESLVVQSFGHAPVADGAVASAVADAAEIDRDLRAQVAGAEMVVTGKVTGVRTVKPPAKSAQSFSTISEHNPIWQEAVIEVADVEKGAGRPKQVVVRFPASTDVQWHEAPKFEPGQEGVFLLSREAVEPKAAAAAARKSAEAYTALAPAAFQPLHKVEAIRTMIRALKS